MGILGWVTVVDQINSETGGALNTVGDVTALLPTGRGVGGAGVVNLYTGAPPSPVGLARILLETGPNEFILQEGGTAPTRIQLE